MFKRNIITVLGMALVVACWVPAAMAAGPKEKKPEASVRFHLLADKTDSAKFAKQVTLTHSGEQVYVAVIPAINELDVIAHYPFAAADGSWGTSFYLNNHGQMSLDAFSIERRGEPIVVVVNGRQLNELLIDQRVSDGIITIPAGLTDQDIALFAKEFPLAGAQPEQER